MRTLIVTLLLLSSCGTPPAADAPSPAPGSVAFNAPEPAAVPIPTAAPAASGAFRADAEQLMGLTKAEAASLLGQPSHCDQESRGESCGYGPRRDGLGLDLFFINGEAANLTLPGYDLPWRADSLRFYNIDAGAPEFMNNQVIRWSTTLAGEPVEVSMFPGENGGIFYVYVKRD